MINRFFGVITDEEYTATHKRERLTIWSPPFASTFEGEAFTLPKGDGYMLTMYDGDKIRVTCSTPRNDANYVEIDTAINTALSDHYARVTA